MLPICDFIAKQYVLALPDQDEAIADKIVGDALERARLKHPDFDRFAPIIDALCTRVFTNHKNFPLDAYLEVLYCAAKHSDFARELRKAKHAPSPPAAAPAELVQ